jgi:tetratricopeptide (TPR) repeat protein
MKSDLGKCRWIFVLSLVLCSSCVSPMKRAERHYQTGMRKIQSGNQTNAVVEFSRAIELNPQYEDAYLFRGAVKYALHDYSGAILDYTKVIELDPQNELAYCDRGLSGFALKDFLGAIADFTKAVEIDTNDATAYNYRGLARANLRNWNDALDDFNKVVELTPQEATAYRNRALIEIPLKEYEKALADADKAIELNGNDVYSYQVRGHAKASLKNFQDALTDFDKVVELTPQAAEAYAARGGVKLLMDDFAGADADLEKAFRLNPNSLLAFATRGFLKEKRGDYTGALADFNRVVEMDGLQLPEASASLGLLQYNLSQWNPALDNLRKAQQIGCTEDDLPFYIWLIQSQSGKADEANKELEAFLNSLQGEKATHWPASIGHFLIGKLPEDKFLNQATTKARRPSAIKGQICESFYYAGMKHKLAGDKPGAVDFFQKCLATGSDNSFGYISAQFELRELNKP